MRTLLALTFLFFMACTNSNKIVAEVGRYKVPKKYIDYRNQVELAYNPSEKRDLGLFQLTRFFQLAEIYQANVQPITQETLLAEEKRINESTANPQMLERIKKIFGSDHQAYLEVFILPVYTEHHLFYSFFAKSPLSKKQSFDEWLANEKSKIRITVNAGYTLETPK